MTVVIEIVGAIFFAAAVLFYVIRPDSTIEVFSIPGWAFFESILVFVAGVAFTYLSIFVTGWEYIWMAVICWSIFSILAASIWYVNRVVRKEDKPEEKK